MITENNLHKYEIPMAENVIHIVRGNCFKYRSYRLIPLPMRQLRGVIFFGNLVLLGMRTFIAGWKLIS